jgi:hypothetical protein
MVLADACADACLLVIDIHLAVLFKTACMLFNYAPA